MRRRGVRRAWHEQTADSSPGWHMLLVNSGQLLVEAKQWKPRSRNCRCDVCQLCSVSACRREMHMKQEDIFTTAKKVLSHFMLSKHLEGILMLFIYFVRCDVNFLV